MMLNLFGAMHGVSLSLSDVDMPNGMNAMNKIPASQLAGATITQKKLNEMCGVVDKAASSMGIHPHPSARITREDISRRVYEGIGRCVRAGFTPTELWLGPDEYAGFQMHCRELCVYSSDERVERYEGLEIKKSVKPGIRVGTTF